MARAKKKVAKKKSAKKGAKKKAIQKRAVKKRRPATPKLSAAGGSFFGALIGAAIGGIASRFAGVPAANMRWSITAHDASGKTVCEFDRPVTEPIEVAIRECEKDPKIERIIVAGRDGTFSMEHYRRRGGIMCREDVLSDLN